MSLYEDWVKEAYNQENGRESKIWDEYLPLEMAIYKDILTNKITSITGTVKELSARFHMSTDFVCGFIDGINEAIETSVDMKELTEDTYVELNIDFEKLYRKMVEYQAEQLYTLPEWNNIYTEEEQKELYKSQKRSTTYVRTDKKVGRNDPCPCGSGKKYKKCCGIA